MNNDERKLIRLIIRQVHPDLFANNPFERQCNSESLKNLNSYVEELSKGRTPRPCHVEFFVREGSNLRRVEASLNHSGSLGPLFYAFGLITADELQYSEGTSSANDTNFLGWLREQVQDAVRTAEKHDVLKWHIRRLKSQLEERFNLSAVQVGAEYAVSLAEQERQVEALKVLEHGLLTLTKDENSKYSFDGMTVQLYHPTSCPQEAYSYVDDNGNFNMRTSYMKAFVGDDGTVHLVADKETIIDQLQAVDMTRARMLTKVSFHWLKRVRDLTPAVTELLGVRSVWCDTKTEQNSQKFVLWAGYLLEIRDEIRSVLGNRKFSFSIIVHADSQGPLINFHQSSPILNVRSDCPAAHLLDFLTSEGGVQASEAANEVHSYRAKEEALLERVRQVFEAKCVIKICMNDKVLEGAMRLLDNAEVIKQAVDLRGTCIALDDCYEVWESGFISIPYNFKIEDLSSNVKMLLSGQRPGESNSEPDAVPSTTAASTPPSANGSTQRRRSGSVGSKNGSSKSSSNGSNGSSASAAAAAARSNGSNGTSPPRARETVAAGCATPRSPQSAASARVGGLGGSMSVSPGGVVRTPSRRPVLPVRPATHVARASAVTRSPGAGVLR